MNSLNFNNLLFLFCALFLVPNILSSQVIINEFMASNTSTIADEAGDFDDWVELYNTSSTPVNVGGMYISDDLASLNLWQIPTTSSNETTIPGNGYLILWFDKDLDQGVLHVDAKLGLGGEDIVLTSSDGITIMDSYTYGIQTEDISEGRVTDGNTEFGFFIIPTPNASNSGNSGGQLVSAPVFSVSGGLYPNTVSLELTSATPGAQIYYTIDGSLPTEASTIYQNAISISASVPIRAKAFQGDLTASSIVTNTYLIGVSHVYPIVALTSHPDDFFGETTGIFPNFDQDIEIETNVEFFEPDGTIGFNQILEAEVSGTSSAAFPQKAISLKAKSSLGSSTIDYAVFPDQPYDDYRSLVLRNSGNDWSTTFFRDACLTSFVGNTEDVGNIISKPDLHLQAYRPSIVYINGQYWGIHNLRERSDDRYIKTHFNLDDDEIDFIENYDEVRAGTIDSWQEFQAFLEDHDFSDQENMDSLKTKIKSNDYMELMVFNLFMDHQDWPGNNNRRFREIGNDKEWQFLAFDYDFAYGLFTNAGWNTGSWVDNSLDRLLNPTEFEFPNPEWATRLFQKLVENEEWRHDFFNLTCDQINTLFTPERMNSRIDDFLTLYDPERDQHNLLWSNLYSQYENADIMRLFADNRETTFFSHYLAAFSDINALAEISINTAPDGAGVVHFSNLKINEQDDTQDWTGTYFQAIDIPIKTTPNPGYIFTGWTGASNSGSLTSTINLSGDNTLTANFVQGSTSTEPIVINEINYNSSPDNNTGDWLELYNPNDTEVNISGWYIYDADNDYFNFPQGTVIPADGYLVLVESFTEFNQVVDVLVGEFGANSIFPEMKFSNNGELLQLFNAAGTLIDEVEYSNEAPWSTNADGFGSTLQLKNTPAGLDNSLAENWLGILPTPGAINGGPVSIINLEEEGLSIYPNPIVPNENLYINLSPNTRAMKLTLVNSSGQILQTINIDENSAAPFFFNVTSLSAGTYFIHLEGNNERSRVEQFIIAK